MSSLQSDSSVYSDASSNMPKKAIEKSSIEADREATWTTTTIMTRRLILMSLCQMKLDSKSIVKGEKKTRKDCNNSVLAKANLL